MKLSKNILFGAFAITLFALSFSFISPSESIEIGAKAPLTDLKLKAIDNSKKTLNELKKDKGLIVVFSCNTCPFVIGGESFPGWEVGYNELAKSAKEMGLGFVLVNSNEAKRDKGDGMKDMIARAEDKEYLMDYVIDKDSKLADAFGAKTTPHVFMLNAEMELVYAGSIDNTWDTKREEDIPYLKNAMEQLLSGGGIQEAQTAPRGCSIKRK
jgi:thioredoxin-related protein